MRVPRKVRPARTRHTKYSTKPVQAKSLDKPHFIRRNFFNIVSTILMLTSLFQAWKLSQNSTSIKGFGELQNKHDKLLVKNDSLISRNDSMVRLLTIQSLSLKTLVNKNSGISQLLLDQNIDLLTFRKLETRSNINRLRLVIYEGDTLSTIYHDIAIEKQAEFYNPIAYYRRMAELLQRELTNPYLLAHEKLYRKWGEVYASFCEAAKYHSRYIQPIVNTAEDLAFPDSASITTLHYKHFDFDRNYLAYTKLSIDLIRLFFNN